MPGLVYQIQYNTNPLSTNRLNLRAADGRHRTLTDTNALINSPARFYRIREQP